jgi:hypothetical protein
MKKYLVIIAILQILNIRVNAQCVPDSFYKTDWRINVNDPAQNKFNWTKIQPQVIAYILGRTGIDSVPLPYYCLKPTGAYAANLLGLSTQIPMRIELYTNGPKKTIHIGKQEIILKPTTPKNMIGAGTKSGLILHALKQIGKDNVTDEMIKQIRSKIEEQDIKHIKKQIQFAPVWVAKIMRSLINEK